MSTPKDNRVIQPYLFFNGRCEEAVEFYRKALGAEVQMMMRYKESPEPPPPGMVPPGFENKVMHTSFRVGETVVMASDGCSAEGPKFEGFSLSVTVANEAEAGRVFAALAEGGPGFPMVPQVTTVGECRRHRIRGDSFGNFAGAARPFGARQTRY